MVVFLILSPGAPSRQFAFRRLARGARVARLVEGDEAIAVADAADGTLVEELRLVRGHLGDRLGGPARGGPGGAVAGEGGLGRRGPRQIDSPSHRGGREAG